MATIIPPPFDATSLDQETLEARLFELIETVFPEWSSRDTRDFGNIILGLQAWLGDLLSYMIVRQGDESRLGTARLRTSVLAIVKLIGYQPFGRTASSADVRLTIVGGPIANDVEIPTGTVVTTSGGGSAIRYETLAPEVILAGQSSAIVGFENSQEAVEQFSASGVANQQLPPLQSNPYLDDSLVLSDQQGVWTQVPNFFGSTSTDLHYVVDVDENDQARIRFSDGARGALPVGTITARYRFGGGASGVVQAGTLTRLQGDFVDTLGNPVVLTAVNDDASTPARDRETISEIKINAPASITAPNRTVSREDFEVRAYETGRIARALMLGRAEDPGLPENSGQLYLVANGGLAPTQIDIDAVVASIEAKPPCIGFSYNVVSAVFLDVDVSTVVHLESGADPGAVRAGVEAALQEYFAAERSGERAEAGLRQVDFGFYLAQSLETGESSIPLSDVLCEIQRVPGVRKVDDRSDGVLLNGVGEDLDVQQNEFPRLGAITVIDIQTGPIP